MATYCMVRKTRDLEDPLPLVFGGVDELTEAGREHGPGRYHVDEFAAAGETLASGHTCRQWGTIIHQADGTIIPKPNPWPE